MQFDAGAFSADYGETDAALSHNRYVPMQPPAPSQAELPEACDTALQQAEMHLPRARALLNHTETLHQGGLPHYNEDCPAQEYRAVYHQLSDSVDALHRSCRLQLQKLRYDTAHQSHFERLCHHIEQVQASQTYAGIQTMFATLPLPYEGVQTAQASGAKRIKRSASSSNNASNVFEIKQHLNELLDACYQQTVSDRQLFEDHIQFPIQESVEILETFGEIDCATSETRSSIHWLQRLQQGVIQQLQSQINRLDPQKLPMRETAAVVAAQQHESIDKYMNAEVMNDIDRVYQHHA